MVERSAIERSSVERSAFDAIAGRYDALFSDHPIGRTLRAEVWRRLDTRFPPGSRVLDIGCGTGVDAAHLAARGVEVVGFDPSAAMIERAQSRADAAGLGHMIRLIHAPAGAIDNLDVGMFDGVIANFGVLNCLSPPELPPIFESLGSHCRPGAVWVGVTMGRFCAWESAWYGVRGDFRRALRRMRPGGAAADLGAGTFRVHYHAHGEIARAARPWFVPVERCAIGAIVPPTLAGGWLERRPRSLERLLRIERRVAGFSPAVAVADHVLLMLERSDTAAATARPTASVRRSA